MARDIEIIQQEILDSKNNEPLLDELNSPSLVSKWRLWTRIVSVAINTFERVLDLAKLDLEEVARTAKAGTGEWLQKRALEFQFSGIDPQVLNVNDGVAVYPIINESLRIITRSSVKSQVNGRPLIKVAKGDLVLEPLNNDEKQAFVSYLDKIAFAGIPIDLVTLESDKLRFEGTIFYDGQFVETLVKDNVKTAINEYLRSISSDDFDGILVREKVIDAIQSVPGVTGVDTLNVKMTGRADQTPIGGSGNVVISRQYETFSGYIVEETTQGNTFDDLITLSVG